ncbi:YjbH domain-containing protein [Spirosoma spitsbergense]|uniref:YjbH domain-containing protein n=1 Tax=Spirosoma spitsbergense TaxID=431554 RepID=UPI00037E0104|nr:YjbH domain-containing protein [Spirosoma spitsbergense]
MTERKGIRQTAKIRLLGGNSAQKGKVRLLMPRAWYLFTLGCMVWPMRESLAQRKNGLSDYENVTVDSTLHRVYYEQRLYRNPLVGMLGLVEALPKAGIDTFVPMYQGVPIAQYRLGSTVSTTTITRPERQAWTSTHVFNSRNYKFDFRLQPEFMAQFGFREQVVESKTNLLLQSQLYLSRGLVLNWGILFPIVNQLDNQALNVRPAPIFLNQFLALDGVNFMSLSAGLFYNDQYGANVQYRHADLTKNWSFGMEAGYTGFYFFPKNGFYYQAPENLLLLADVAYRIPAWDITLKLSGGQYMYQDRGVRVDFIRQMGSVEVGFFTTKTRNGTTGGFNFAIPIPPGRIAQTQRVRLRTTEEFRWEYAYTRGYNIATRYRVGNQLDALLRQYHNSYIQNQYRQY